MYVSEQYHDYLWTTFGAAVQKPLSHRPLREECEDRALLPSFLAEGQERYSILPDRIVGQEIHGQDKDIQSLPFGTGSGSYRRILKRHVTREDVTNSINEG